MDADLYDHLSTTITNDPHQKQLEEASETGIFRKRALRTVKAGQTKIRLPRGTTPLVDNEPYLQAFLKRSTK